MRGDCRLATILAHAGIGSDEATGALAAPIHFSTTCQHPEFGKSTGFNYTRAKNSARATLEKTLAAIERAGYALATSSGMSAIILAFEVFPAGAKVVAARDLYGDSFRWFNDKEKEGRFSFEYTDTEVEFLTTTSNDTDIVYVGIPTNPLVVEFDIEKVANAAHAKGVKFIIDNTFYSPIYRNPIPLRADIAVHSTTKCLTGHNDVLAGVVIANDKETYDRLFYNLNTTGPALSPFDFYMLMHGLKTLKLRIKKSTGNARDTVTSLEKLPAIKGVLYTGKGSVVSFRMVDESKAPDIINSLDVITFAESLGGMESLVTYPKTQTRADIPEKIRLSYRLTNDLLRLFIGIEDVEDLINGLRHALEA